MNTKVILFQIDKKEANLRSFEKHSAAQISICVQKLQFSQSVIQAFINTPKYLVTLSGTKPDISFPAIPAES